MNDVSLNPEIVELEAEMEYEMPQYPVIPNPEGEPTEEITKMGIDDVIYEVADAEARATLLTKVDKVEGKGLSTNDYTDEAKAIVDGTPSALELKADKTEVESALADKVDKVEGKGLSENDFTDTLKSKLDGIEAEANKTVVDVMISPTSTNPVQNKSIYDFINDLLPEATATGNPIAITNASGLNAKSLKVELEPIQDLNGYDSPWVGGGRKNKHQLLNSFDTHPSALSSVTRTYTNGEVTISGTTSASNMQFYVEDISSILQSLGTATVSLKVLNGSANDFQIRINIEENGSVVARESIIGVDRTYTYESTKTYYLLMYTKNPLEPNTNLSLKCAVQIESGNQATSYAPYSNICPISGRTQTEIRKCGFNIWDEEWEVGNIDQNTGQNASSSSARFRSKNYIPVQPSTTYYIKSSSSLGFRYYKADKTYIGAVVQSSDRTFTTPSNAYYLRFVNTSTDTYGNDISINYPSTETSYNAYNGEDITIQFGQTVYGGEVDVTNGETDSKFSLFKLSDTDSTKWQYNATNKWFSYQALNNTIKKPADNDEVVDIYCSQYAKTSRNYLSGNLNADGLIAVNTTGNILFRDLAYNTVQTFLQAYGNCQVLWERNTPTTINTPANEISLNKGNNTLTADGDMELIYSKTPQ